MSSHDESHECDESRKLAKDSALLKARVRELDRSSANIHEQFAENIERKEAREHARASELIEKRESIREAARERAAAREREAARERAAARAYALAEARKQREEVRKQREETLALEAARARLRAKNYERFRTRRAEIEARKHEEARLLLYPNRIRGHDENTQKSEQAKKYAPVDEEVLDVALQKWKELETRYYNYSKVAISLSCLVGVIIFTFMYFSLLITIFLNIFFYDSLILISENRLHELFMIMNIVVGVFVSGRFFGSTSLGKFLNKLSDR